MTPLNQFLYTEPFTLGNRFRVLEFLNRNDLIIRGDVKKCYENLLIIPSQRHYLCKDIIVDGQRCTVQHNYAPFGSAQAPMFCNWIYDSIFDIINCFTPVYKFYDDFILKTASTDYLSDIDLKNVYLKIDLSRYICKNSGLQLNSKSDFAPTTDFTFLNLLFSTRKMVMYPSDTMLVSTFNIFQKNYVWRFCHS